MIRFRVNLSLGISHQIPFLLFFIKQDIGVKQEVKTKYPTGVQVDAPLKAFANY